MNARMIAFLLATMTLPLAIAVAASPQDAIIVNNAKQVKETSVSIDPGLTNSIAGISPRVVVQYSNDIRRSSLLAIPSALQTLLSQMSARVVVQYANTIRRNNLTVVPGALQTLLGQMADRVIVQYAVTSRIDWWCKSEINGGRIGQKAGSGKAPRARERDVSAIYS
ncbi:MAG: hypothetical protein FJ009_09205 [Chloroflexi bacterium]|nr:hypothetical protein [Chloroflexota bacterium]